MYNWKGTRHWCSEALERDIDVLRLTHVWCEINHLCGNSSPSWTPVHFLINVLYNYSINYYRQSTELILAHFWNTPMSSSNKYLCLPLTLTSHPYFNIQSCISIRWGFVKQVFMSKSLPPWSLSTPSHPDLFLIRHLYFILLVRLKF